MCVRGDRGPIVRAIPLRTGLSASIELKVTVTPPTAPPTQLAPMLATAGALPPSGRQERYGFEFKWDGIRALARWDGVALCLTTRNRRDVTVAFPELEPLAAELGTAALLDGEIVALDDAGIPSFQLLQDRMHVTNAHTAKLKAAEIPVAYFIFDVLHLDTNSCLPCPWHERRQLLEGLGLDGAAWATPPALIGEGDAALAAARARGLEGVVAKEIDSIYVPGARSSSWVKIKFVHRDDFVVGGWFPGEGRRAAGIGSLLLSVRASDGRLQFVGAVGTGFTDRALKELEKELRPLIRPTSPFSTPLPPLYRRTPVFVEPHMVVDIEYREQTLDGYLRHPSYKGVRIDKSPVDVNTSDRQ